MKAKKISKEDFDALIRTIKTNARNSFYADRDSLMIIMLYNYGMRISELCNLKVSDINFQEKYICLDTLKRGRKRQFPINDTIKIMLKIHIRKYNIENYIFTTKSNKKINSNWWKLVFNRYKKIACINPNITTHSFRHNLIKQLDNKHMPIRMIQYLAGHTQLQSTQQYLDTDYNEVKNFLDAH